ncbi:P-loop containing nucleoside triphosphate hydrolase protein [Lophiostoma macrostomum CBS 122681]|uniref:P-loop containing nucleoside triphosphate hydrolase protein n=1 Tax=Lophiostoma macrostomum CBS 122681 TaxID=1314788 RepID=A0A6A6T3T1_9PLEO|nr:P-loop containing nucleoside triphosphate hydrolase protein [Lophiostoma macrostomum CBS 122681]
MSQQTSPLAPVIITGPSGVGKSTLIQKLLSSHPKDFTLCKPHTTRAPRPGEVNYHFVNPKIFETLIAQGAFLEWTRSSSGDYYGTSNIAVLKAMATGKTPVLNVAVDGVKQMMELGMPWRYVFVKPASLEALEARIRNREAETEEEDVRKSLERGRVEMEYAESEMMFHKVIVNDELEKAYGELEKFLC